MMSEDQYLNKSLFIKIKQLSTGFIEVPGKISINIYAQGCSKRCPGCHNPDCQDFNSGEKLFLTDIDIISKDYDMANWICWLGGDAVYQPEALKAFNKEFKLRGYGVALYTGKLFEEIQDLVENVDLVVDGEWTGKTIRDQGTNQSIRVKNNINQWLILNTWENLDFWYNERLILNAV